MASQSGNEEKERKLLMDTIVKEMIAYSNAAGMPKGFIDGITVKHKATANGKSTWTITNTWVGENGEPLAHWFEEGTKRNYPIEPRIYQEANKRRPKYAKESYLPSMLHWERPAGKHYFRRKVIHPGQPPRRPMAKGFEAGQKALVEKIKRDSSG